MRLLTFLIVIGTVVVVHANVLADSSPSDTTCNSWMNTGLDNSDYPDSCDDDPQCPTVTVTGPARNPGTIIVSCNGIMCDDIDRYCTDRPPCPEEPPAPCYYLDGDGVNHATPWVTGLRQVWQRTSYNEWLSGDELCGTEFNLETPTYNASGQWKLPTASSVPYAARYPNGGSDLDELGKETLDLEPLLEAKYGTGNTTVNGTNEQPLYLHFTMSSGIMGASGMGYNVGYMELAMQEEDYPAHLEDEARTPMDFVMVGEPETEDCDSCYAMCPGPEFSVHVDWPTVCQSYEPRTGQSLDNCPPAKEDTWHALAIGTNAYLDTNPCHCENPADQVPSVWHLAIFDGYKWLILRDNHYGPTGSGATGTGDFQYCDKLETVDLTIYGDHMDVHHMAQCSNLVKCVDGFCNRGPRANEACNEDNDCKRVHSYAYDIPRVYTGAFNRMRAGTSTGCELKDNVYECKQVGGAAKGEIRKCLKGGGIRCDGGGYQTNKAGNIIFDTIGLYAGAPVATDGACCIPEDGSCEDNQTVDDCNTLGGAWRGGGSECTGENAELCCVDPFADADHDQDVDQVDFGLWQVCFSGEGTAADPGCECFMRDDSTGAQGGDSDVDDEDFDWFQDCWTGPKVPSDTTCDGTLYE